MGETVKGIRLDERDNVATVIQAVHAGATVVWCEGGGGAVLAEGEVPRFHKIAIAAIEQGGTIRKYGRPIGAATAPIPKGTHVHTHNCAGTAVEEMQ